MASVMFNKTIIHTVRGKGGLVGFQYRNKPYVIGFPEKKDALRIATHLDPKRTIDVQRFRIEEVADEINSGLSGIDKSVRVKDVSIELEAILTIPKQPKPLEIPLTVVDLSYDVFLMYPFQKCIGIAMPFLKLSENNDKWTYMSQIIDPCETVEMFRNSLK